MLKTYNIRQHSPTDFNINCVRIMINKIDGRDQHCRSNQHLVPATNGFETFKSFIADVCTCRHPCCFAKASASSLGITRLSSRSHLHATSTMTKSSRYRSRHLSTQNFALWKSQRCVMSYPISATPAPRRCN